MKPAGALALLLLAAPLARAQPAPSPSPTPRGPISFEAEAEMVSVTAVVRDKEGHFLRGLGKQDVEVYEDGVKQDLVYFREASGKEAERIPLSVVLVLDASGSMRPHMRFLQEAAISFLSKMEEGDRALVVDFNSGIRSSSEFTGDLDRLEQFVNAVQAWGSTSLYDAVHYGLNRIKDQPGRKAVVVFSDGEDVGSTLKQPEVLDYTKAVEATIYSIGFRGKGGLFARGPRGFLRRIAEDSGGAFFFPEKVGELIRVFRAISDELLQHYALAYAPRRVPDGTWRAIEVRLKRKDAVVRVRKGYFAVKRPARAAGQPAS